MASIIEGNTCAETWERSIIYLIQKGTYVASVRGPVLECPNVSLLVSRPWEEPRISKHSPLFDKAENFSSSIIEHQRIINWDGINQIEYVINLLRDDPLSRRAVISVWDPRYDIEKENSQGVVAFVFQIRNNQLHLSCLLRTTDAWMCNWTLASYPELQRTVFNELHTFSIFNNLELGTYTQIHSSFHIYLDEVKNAEMKLLGIKSRRSGRNKN